MNCLGCAGTPDSWVNKIDDLLSLSGTTVFIILAVVVPLGISLLIHLYANRNPAKKVNVGE